MTRTFHIQLANTFEAENPEDAVRQMSVYAADYAHKAGYRVTAINEDGSDGDTTFIDAEELPDTARTFHVTVEQRHVLTYQVTTDQEGVTDEATATTFIQQADAETLDNHQVHEETLNAEVVTVEDVTG